MSRRDDKTLLQDMLEAARSAVGAIEAGEQAALASDHVRALGLVKCLEIVGEAAGRLSRDFRGRHSAIPWDQIIGMRNRLVHAYFEIDYEQVWKTLTEDLPQLIEQWERILAEESRSGAS
jgi:uncharacterized protein with HEPN domain